MVASLRVLSILLKANTPASQLCSKFEVCPQKLENIPFYGENPLKDAALQEKIFKQKERLSGSGRLLIRESGTERIIRIMCESDNPELMDEVMDELVDVISGATG